MSQVNSKTKDNFQVVLLLSCFMGHTVCALCVGLGKVPLTNQRFSKINGRVR